MAPRVALLHTTFHLKDKTTHPKHLLPPIDLGIAARILEKEGCETFFFDTAVHGKTPQTVFSFLSHTKPDILVIKPNLAVSQETVSLVNAIKQNALFAHMPVVVVGNAPTYLVTRFLHASSCIDYVVLGEFENALARVVDCLVTKKKCVRDIPGLCWFASKLTYARGVRTILELDDFDSLPSPKHELFINQGYSFYYPTSLNARMRVGFVMTSRGCPYSCSFCSEAERASHGKKYRYRSAQHIADEFECLHSKGVNFVYILDDLFTLNSNRVIELCAVLAKRKTRIKWAVQSRVDTLNEPLISAMRSAGCTTVCMGLESGSDRILKNVQKGTSVEKIRKAVFLCNKYHINIVGYFIIGNESETLEEIEKTITLANSLDLDMIQVAHLTEYPAASLFKGDINAWSFTNRNEEVQQNFSRVDTKTLEALQSRFYRSFYFSPRFLFRFITRHALTFVLNLDKNIPLIRDTLRVFT
ncbi:hypothetical protein COT72_00395 [archaeon CG10_big_fil_rev_8_21_14_0_10_43_11]|nr:MAG: hypothetical protein COT72_00395 [archaeon CG10_big_fil_rev_8_21_14_0_10_43_11]